MHRIPVAKKCLCCVNLRTGALIAGILEVLIFLSDFIITGLEETPFHQKYGIEKLGIPILITILNVLGGFFGILLIYGALMKNLTLVAVNVLGVLCICLMFICVLLEDEFSLYYSKEGVVYFVFKFILVIYLWSIAHSYQQSLRNLVNTVNV